MGKWSKFKQDLPKAPIDEKYQTQVNQAKAKIQEEHDTSLGSLGVLYAEARHDKERLKAELSGCDLILEAIEQMLVNDFEKQKIDQYRLDSGELLSLSDQPYCSLENKKDFLAWIEQTGLEDLLSVHYQTMNSVVKERLENGEMQPPGIKVFMKSGISFRKSPNK